VDNFREGTRKDNVMGSVASMGYNKGKKEKEGKVEKRVSRAYIKSVFLCIFYK
jgi:hypothetical protein